MAASKRRRSDRALRPPMCSPGRPTVGRREHRQRFWEEVAGGLSSEKSAVAAGVSPGLARAGFANVVACHLSVFVLCRGATYRSSSEKRLRFFMLAVAACARSPGSWAAHRRRSRENSAERSNTKWKPRVSSHSRPMACRSTSETSDVAKLAANSELRQYVQDRLGGLIAAPDGAAVPGPNVRWVGRRHGRRSRPAVGGLVESRADRQQATGRLSR